jgi:hypothetical protein
MSTNWKTVITTVSVVAALAGGSALHAQTTEPSKPQSGGMMMQGQQGDMMGMMAQMNQMMESCNKMMEGMNMGDRPGTKKYHKSPEKQS